jgi:excinuclease ABC subunit C
MRGEPTTNSDRRYAPFLHCAFCTRRTLPALRLCFANLGKINRHIKLIEPLVSYRKQRAGLPINRHISRRSCFLFSHSSNLPLASRKNDPEIAALRRSKGNSNRNSAAIRNRRKSLIQKEKTFSNRNKNRRTLTSSARFPYAFTLNPTPCPPSRQLASRATKPQCILVPMLDLDCSLIFAPSYDADFFQSLPPRPGVMLLEMLDANAQPYLARTADIRRAAERLLREPETLSKRLNLRAVAARIRYRVTGSKFEQTIALYQQARLHFPRRYRDVMRLRPPALLKVNLRNEYPRCYVTRRIRADEGFYFGPFASRRSAEAFSEGFLDLFKIRRCQIKIRRDPSFPGCIYSEMKMCLAPCFAGCSKEEYDAEVGRVLETLDTTGAALTERFEREREAASEALDFERAAALHKRLEKVSGALRGLPELARRVEDLDAVILQRAAEEKTIIVFPFHAGILGEPLFLRFAEIASEPRSVEAILREHLQPGERPAELKANPAEPESTEGSQTEVQLAEPSPEASALELPATFQSRYGLQTASTDLPEHLSLLARWFYSKPREGEIFFRAKDWPYRRILRACARLLAPPASPPVGTAPEPEIKK